MKQVVIENPILNSPFVEPARHFKFTEEGITDEVVEARRISSYFVPIARPKKKGKSAQLTFETEWTQDRVEENKFINQIRYRVALWRQGGYQGVTKTTRQLLDYWRNPARDRKLFFCQIEAVETAIYITEVANKYGDAWIENDLRRFNEDANPLLSRIAFKMATGSGKTVVMAMLIAWHVLNKLANPQDARFSDTFLIVTPGITIRDRLRVLLPNDPQNYYRQWDILDAKQQVELGKAKILITNFHAFKPRERGDAARLTKSILAQGVTNAFTETPDQMVRRVCRELGNKKNILVINDEAHHCYRRRAGDEEVKLTGDERKEAEKREEEARIWISGLEAVKEKIGVKVVYDLSATPFFLRGSGYPEATLFPWVVSDFSLIDAIECGIVKVPRVPVADDSMIGDQPTYRDLWLRIREHLPKKGRGTDAVVGEPKPPKELQGALHSLYGNYEKYYRQWENNTEARTKGQTPPVFIVVCNNTNVSKLVYDYIAGWEKPLPNDSAVVVPGQLSILSNEENGVWRDRPNTILIDSEQLESGDAMSADFKKLVAFEIEEFKAEYRARFPGRDAESLTDEDLLREVMNTVGKPGKLGEQVKCVVSVSMLTEGWDANTVTHILGVRAFGTQLLCEQVVGRGLRRVSYVANPEGRFEPEYAEVYGVPFSFIPCSGSATDPKPGPMPTRVRALEERIACEITFPRLLGYRYDLPGERLSAKFTDESKLALSTADIPTKVQLDPIVGESSEHTLDDLKRRRPQEVAFLLAKLVLEKYFRDDDDNVKPWLFPQLLTVAKRWLSECVVFKDNTFPQLLLLIEFAHDAADRIYKAIVQSNDGEKALKPILQPYDTVGSTRYVDFDTTRPVYATDPARCHISHVDERLYFVTFFDEYPITKLTNAWYDTRGEMELSYIVQTNTEIVQRCILMSTDPGDLVVDPTCGSGTTAYVAEQWGRRWITCDTSRVALTLARTRLMAARFPYYLLADSPEGIAKEADLTGQFPSERKTEGDIKKGFVYKRVPHVTLGSIANNPNIKEGMTREQIDAAIAKHAETEILYDEPYEDNKRIRVSGPFTVESLSPHRVLATDEERPASEQEAAKAPGPGQFETMILDNLKKAGVQNTVKKERLTFDRLEPYAGVYLHGGGEYTEGGKSRRVAICIGPEHGTVGPELVKEAAKEAVRGLGFDLLVVCGFAFDPHVSEEAKQYGKLTVLMARMNPDLSMGDELLKKTGAANLFMVFGEPDVKIAKQKDRKLVVEIKGVDVYDPTTGQIRSHSTADIACWFIDTDYNEESFFVRHAYFCGADEPYEKLKRALRAEIDEAAWSSLYKTVSRPFDPPMKGKIAIKVINHYGDEVLKVYEV